MKADAVVTSPPYPGVYDYLAVGERAEAIGLRRVVVRWRSVVQVRGGRKGDWEKRGLAARELRGPVTGDWKGRHLVLGGILQPIQV